MEPDKKKLGRNVILEPEENLGSLILGNVYTLNNADDLS